MLQTYRRLKPLVKDKPRTFKRRLAEFNFHEIYSIIDEFLKTHTQDPPRIWPEAQPEWPSAGSAALADKTHVSFLAWKIERSDDVTNAVWNGLVTMEDVPEEFRGVAELLGMEAFFKLIALYGGQDLYIPKRDILERGPRDWGHPGPLQRGATGNWRRSIT